MRFLVDRPPGRPLPHPRDRYTVWCSCGNWEVGGRIAVVFAAGEWHENLFGRTHVVSVASHRKAPAYGHHGMLVNH